MKISELIKKLEEVRSKHGDLQCVCHDGLDPSDPAIVVDVEITHEYCWGLPIGENKAAQITS